MIKCLFLFIGLIIVGKINLYAQRSNGNHYGIYKSMLTNEDLNKLRQGKEVFLDYSDVRHDISIKGTVRVLPTKTTNEYNFVEIGEWTKWFDFKGLNNGNKQVKIEMSFDSLGNIISSKAFHKKKNQNQFILREELSLIQDQVNGKPYHFYHVKSYYDTGELWIEGLHRILDFDLPLSHYEKKSVPAKYEKKYDKKGVVKKEKSFPLTGE